MKIVKQLLDYCSMQKEAIITYNASKMILAVHKVAQDMQTRKNHEAELVDIFSYQTTINPPPTMVQFSPYQPS